MKKLLYCAAALAMALFAGSCQQEKLEPVAGNGTVTFTVEAPATIQTKAIADGLNVNELVYEVWLTEEPGQEELFGDKKAERLYQSKTTMKVEDDGTNKASVTLDLVNDQNFTVLFWAQVNTTEYPAAYDTEELTNVTYAKDEYQSNDDNLAAFYSVAFVKDCSHIDTDGKSISSNVILRRPFAQLNIGTTNSKKKPDDGSRPTDNYTVELVSSAVEVTTANTIFNVSTGAVSGNRVVTFSDAKVPDEVLKVQKNGNEEPYEYVAMNYLFAGSNASVEYDIVTKLNGNDKVTATINNTVDNVPLKENYRTNIIGNLLTNNVDYEIVVQAGFYTPDEVVEVVTVSSAAELVEAIAAAPSAEGEETNIKLEGDINLSDLFESLTKTTAEEPKKIIVPTGLSATIDLNGYSLTGVDEETSSFGLIENRGNLTITNSSSTQSRIALVAKENRGWNAYSSVISNNPGGNLLVKGNVLIEHLGGTDMAYGIDNLTNGKGTSAIATVDGATVTSPYRAIRQFLNGVEANNSLTVKTGSVIKSTKGNKSIWMQDPSTNANTGSLVVEEGAELYGNVYISATAGSTEWPVSASVAASALKDGSEVEISPKELVGYNVVLNDGVYVFEQSWSVNPEQTEYTIYTATGLKWVAEEVNKVEQYAKNIFDGKTVLLANDIDLNGAEWIPIGDFGNTSNQFTGTFDGQNHTISNFVVDFNENKVDTKNRSSFGFFGNVNGTVKNLTVSGVTNDIQTPKFVGALIGRLNGGLVENCHVKNSIIEIENWTVGALVGQINNGKISGCSVEGTNVIGYGAVAAIAGIALDKGERTIENCSVKNCTISQNGSFGGNYDKMFGAIVGALYSSELTVNLMNCSVESTTINGTSSTELCGFVSAGGKLIVDGYEILASGLAYNGTSKTYAVSSAEGLVAMSKTTIKGGESVILTADIDLTGVEFNGLNAFNPEPNNTFDGQEHTVSNWTYTGGASDMAFIKNWVGTIKNVTIENASLKTSGRSAVLAGNAYVNIDNCHVVNSRIEDSYWACGVIAGLYNSGSITNCSVDGCYVKSNGGVGGIVGVINESAGERKIENCTVKNTTVNNTGAYGEGYSGALVAGMFNAGNATYKFVNCTLENNTKEGQYVGDLFYSAEGETVYVDGVQQ